MKLSVPTVVYLTIFGASICIFAEGESFVNFMSTSRITPSGS